MNPLTSWKEPSGWARSVTLLVFPEKSLDTASTVRRPYRVQPLVMPSTLAVMISGGQDEVGIISKYPTVSHYLMQGLVVAFLGSLNSHSVQTLC